MRPRSVLDLAFRGAGGAPQSLPRPHGSPAQGACRGCIATLLASPAMSSKRKLEGAETLPLEGAPATTETLPPESNFAGTDTLPPARDLANTEPPSLEDTAGPVPSGGAPPGRWDRYEILDLLGKGGMGSVYRARDRRLDRTIAIKFLLSADPNLTLRLLREARAQARIDHPNICRVYEVGEVSGRAYIALQLIDGEPLSMVAARMSLDEKVAVMRDVAVAVQEAHRLGIVHRDLKPANIMVERTEDGRWLPVVMDFGLAREVTVEAGLTESGTLLGTPAYMSPEQARGDVRSVDRRSDVYSLGATLYELLTERPPFTSTSLAEVLAQVIHDDPPAPRSLVLSLPLDLETIVQKCLAKDPPQRYASARALADDLGRYLDGEPILGRRRSRWQRLRRWTRRHRALVTLGACSLAVIVAVGAFGVRAWLISRRERARTHESSRLAEQLGREATEIEGYLREAYQWPLHDTRSDRKRIRARMTKIAATQHDLDNLGDAIIHDALGRGHLALHEWQEAADEFGRAKAAGRQTPELHAAHGRALGELYRRALEETRPQGDSADDKAWFVRRQQELMDRYLTPALAELEQSRALGEDTSLLEARIALYRRDFAAAEQQALEIAAHSPGLSDAPKLAADAAYGAAVQAFDHGDYEAARLALERATKLYAETSEIARSDASVYEAAAQAWAQLAELDVRQSRSPRASLEHALDVIDHRALRADPDDAAAYMTKSDVLLHWCLTPSLAGPDDQRPLLERIAEAAARAVEIDPRDARAWDALGYVHVYRGRYEVFKDREGDPWYQRALGEIGKALTLQPDDPRANSDLGAAHRWLGSSLDSAGRDPMSEYQAALRSYQRATEIDPQYVSACSSQVNLYTSIAEYDDSIGVDPSAAVTSALRVGERCLTLDPNFYLLLDNLAQAQLALAHYLVEIGDDPTAPLESARDYLDRLEKAQFESLILWYHRLVAASTEATFRLRQGVDPARSITTGRAALKEALRLYPDSADSYVEAARLDLAEAAWAAHTANGAMSILARALADAEKAVALDGQSAMAKITAAKVCLQVATAQPTRAIVDRGIAYVDQTLQRNPRLVEAQTVRAALLRLHPP